MTGDIIQNDKEAADTMNKFFTSIGPTLAATFHEPWNYSGKLIENNINNISTDRIELLKLIKEIDINKSSAIPNLSSKVMKPPCIVLLDHFTYMMNLCLEQNL